MRFFICVVFLLLSVLLTETVHAGSTTCTIEKSITTGFIVEKQMVSTEKITIEMKPSDVGYTFPLLSPEVWCELRVPNPKGGSFLSCWTPDRKIEFSSNRTLIEGEPKKMNTLTYTDEKKHFKAQVTVTCE